MILKKYFFHPDFTVGFGITPNHAKIARGLYHRYGIAPIPEEKIFISVLYIVISPRRDFVNKDLHI